MDKALSYLSLARKGGHIELGEEPVGAVTRACRAALVIVADDASDHTWRRAQSFVAGTAQPCLRIPHSKEAFGQSVGRTSLAIAAVTDPALALAFVRALPQPEQYRPTLQALETRVERLRQRQKETSAHLRNRRLGKHRSGKQEH